MERQLRLEFIPIIINQQIDCFYYVSQPDSQDKKSVLEI